MNWWRSKKCFLCDGDLGESTTIMEFDTIDGKQSVTVCTECQDTLDSLAGMLERSMIRMEEKDGRTDSADPVEPSRLDQRD